MVALRHVTASRYVTPLREGGSLPAIVEADDEGMYVLKFRGAGQGPRALIAELLAGQIARMAGLAVPDIVLVDLPGELARTEPDPEIQALIRSSVGLNIGLDYLPGSVTFDPLVYEPDAQLASAIVWFDAFVCNVDRTVRNVNMLMWHRRLWLIDHGAALYFHHAWSGVDGHAENPFTPIKDHVLLKYASELPRIDSSMASCLTVDGLARIVESIPSSWLPQDPQFDPASQRDAYLNFFVLRMRASRIFVEEAIRARSSHL